MPLWNQLTTAAIVAVVVVFSLKIGNDGIAHAADKITDLTGLEFGSPSLSSFTAIPDGSGNMRFQLSLGGVGKSNVELLIYRRYEPTPEKELGVPDFKEENIVFDILPDTTTESGQKLKAVLEKGVIKKVCPKDADVTKGKNGCDSTKGAFEPGGYRFVAVLKKGGKVIDSRSIVTGFYDENYLEMLNKPVFGCEDFNFRNCNVIECKKQLINTNLQTLSDSPSRVRKESGVLRSISNEFRAEKGFSASNDCGKIGYANGKVIDNDKDISALFLLTAGCNDKDIDDLNIKVVRARLLESAFEGSGQSITSEEAYATNTGKLDFWKDKAVKMTMGCTLGWPSAPKGASNALQSLNWQLIPPGGKTDVWKGRVNAELDRFLNSKLRPRVADAVAGVNKDRQLTLAWKLPIGKDSLTKYQLKLFYSNAALNEKLADVKKLADAKKIRLAEIALPKQPAKGEASFRYPEAGGLTQAQMGAYWFELGAFDSTGQSSVADAHTGIYDNNYVELYRVRDVLNPSDFYDACGDSCNVVRKKESALGNDLWSYTKIAFDRHKGEFQASCQLAPYRTGAGRIKDCMPSEVDVLYRDVVTEYYSKTKGLQTGKTTADLLKIDCKFEENWISEQGIRDVCDAKSKLKAELEKAGWIYLRW